MRLLTHNNHGELCVTEDLETEDIPPYAILSHTWGRREDEVTFHEIGKEASHRKAGYQKIEFCVQQAQRDGWRYVWADTCCIDKTNAVELSDAINSMYQWYQRAQVCYVYLADVSHTQATPETVTTSLWEASFRQSRWFTRGWTLQELLAPRDIVFYSREGHSLGTKSQLLDLLRDITGIPVAALVGKPLSQFSVGERWSWARGRRTTKKEDEAYCLLGIFGIRMPLIYGEGIHALYRLEKEINKQTNNDPFRLGHLPASAPLLLSDAFIGRDTEINAIHGILRPDEPAIQQRRVVLGGLSGIGKTQLAIAYARQYGNSYTSVLWLGATPHSTLIDSLRSIVQVLTTDSEFEKLSDDQMFTRVHTWLSISRNAGWLLIVDNDDEFSIARFYSDINHGSIIITTRLSEKVTGPQLRVGPLTSIEDSLHILQIRSGRQDVENDPGARRLAQLIEGLPLALTFVGTYLSGSTISFQEYLDAREGRMVAYERELMRNRTLNSSVVNHFSAIPHARGKLGAVKQILARARTDKGKQANIIRSLGDLPQSSWKDSAYESALRTTQAADDANDVQTVSATGASLAHQDVEKDREQVLPIATTEYAPSVVSNLTGLRDDTCINDFAKDLYDIIKPHHPDDGTLEQILHVLPDLLKVFAQKFGNKAENQIHKDISYFFQRNRDDIRNTLKRLFESENFRPGDFAISRFLNAEHANTSDNIETIDMHEMVGFQRDSSQSDAGENIDSPLDPDFQDPSTALYRNIITNTTAYDWLAATLRRELNVIRARPDVMDRIGRDILRRLPTTDVISRRAPVTPCRVSLECDWDPIAFVAEQEYAESLPIALERAVTLTGSARDAQAATTYDYLVQTWPATGDLVMQVIKEAVCAKDRCATSILPDGTEIKLQFLAGSISTVEVFGPRTSIAEIAEQFSWLGAALRSSPFESGIALCTPEVRDVRGVFPRQITSESKPETHTIIKIHFGFVKTASDTTLPGHCWHNMFRNPVVVGGYPILTKGSQGKGVEMPLDMMFKLVRADRASFLNGSIFLKGFSTMLLAVQLTDTVLVWHYLYNPKGQRISYLDHMARSTANIALHQLNITRHVVGWCESAEHHAGAATANYDIDGTGLEPPHAGCVLEKVSIGGGKFVTASLTIALGLRDTPLYVTVKGYLNKLGSIATEYFVLWDDADKRGWLVNGASALLHLVKASLHHYSKEYAFAFLLDFSKMKHPEEFKPSSALGILFDNRDLAVFPDKHGESAEISEEQVGSSVSEKQILKKKVDYFLFGDLVEQHYGNLELIVDGHRYMAGKDGINMKMRMRKHLEGWDFFELATDHKHLNPRVATLSALGYGWVDFVRSIHAIPLFGRGFGDIIRPAASDNGICSQWNTLPKYKYYLAASMYDMKRVVAKHGNKYADPLIPVHGLIWNCPEQLFAPCECQQHPTKFWRAATKKHLDPVQTFCPAKLKLLLRVKGPGRLSDEGAVVFGHNISWGYRWQEDGKQGLEEEHRQQITPTPEPITTPDVATSDSHSAIVDPSLLVPQSGPHAYNRPTRPDRAATSGSGSQRSRVYTIGGSSSQTTGQSVLWVSSSIDSQTTSSAMGPPSTNTGPIVAASSRSAGILRSREREQVSGSLAEQKQQKGQLATAVDDIATSSSQQKNRILRHGWHRFWKKDAI